DRIHPRAAVLFRHFDPHQAHLAHLADRLQRGLACLLVECGDRVDLALREITHGLTQHFVFVGEFKDELRQGSHSCYRSLSRRLAPVPSSLLPIISCRLPPRVTRTRAVALRPAQLHRGVLSWRAEPHPLSPSPFPLTVNGEGPGVRFPGAFFGQETAYWQTLYHDL